MSISKRKSFLFSGLVCLVFLSGCGSDKYNQVMIDESVVEDSTFDYQAEIDNAISETIPGIVLLVETDDFKFLGASGVANKETLEPMETYHIIPTGSAGKKLTALLAVLLEQEGVFSLDDNINAFLDDEVLSQIEYGESMSVRQLLNHTSGVFDYLDDSKASVFYDALLLSDVSELKLDEYALSFALNEPAYSVPGEAFNYSNTGYLLVGLIMNSLIGEHHSIAMRNRIFEPLGMNASFYGGIEKEYGDIISGYYSDDTIGTLDTKPYYENIGFADAPLRSNVEDLALLLKSIVSDDSLFAEAVRERFFDDSVVVSIDDSTDYGLGIFIEELNGNTVFHHGGLEAGYTTVNIFIEDTQTSITAFFNCGLTTQCETETDQVIQSILDHELSE